MERQMRRQLQRLLQNNDWSILETFLDKYMKDNFLHASFKKDTEFDTIWYAAFGEGGKHHVQKFIQYLEQEAHLADQ